MVTAIVLMNVVPDKVNEVAEQLVSIDGVREVYSVAGRYDLAAVINTKHNEDLSEVVTKKFLKVDGITESETLIAFRTFSKYDLAAMFEID